MKIIKVNRGDKLDLNNSALIITLEGCPPCNELKKEFIPLARILEKYKNETAKIYNIDSKIFSKLKIMEVTSFPTILIFKNGILSKTFGDGDGDRSVDNLKQFFISELGLIQTGGAKRKNKSKRNSKRNNTRRGKRNSKCRGKCKCKGTRKCMCNKNCKCKGKI
jgi:thiol-disulfide isomerase/thioredoxin